MNTQILQQILSKNEIKVYFALLELDQSSATPIVKKAGIPNSKVYPILDKLIKKGLVSYVIKNNVKYFQASDPNNLIDLLNEKEKQIIKQKSEINKIIPQIELKRKLAKEKQEATVYEGYDGLKSAFMLILNTLKKGEEYYVFTLGEELSEKQLILFLQQHHKKRRKRGIRVRLIANEKLKGIITKHHSYTKLRFRYSQQKLPIGTFIFKDHVMTVLWGERPTAFVIKSKQNYKYYKEFFEDVWKKAKK